MNRNPMGTRRGGLRIWVLIAFAAYAAYYWFSNRSIDPLTGQAVVATLTLAAPEDAKELRRRVRAHCADRLERFKIPVRVEQAGDFQHSARFKKDRRFHGGQAV